MVAPQHGESVIEHSGGTEGFSTTLSYIPASKLTVTVLSNVERAAEWVIAGQIMDVMLGDPVSLGEDAASLPKVTLRYLAGVYTSSATAPDVPFKVSVIDRRVYLQRGPVDKVRVLVRGRRASLCDLLPDYDAEFQIDITDKVARINLR